MRCLPIAILLLLLIIPPYTFASAYVDVSDDTYDLLLRLEAEGVITSGLLTTRPLSRKEVIRLILEAEGNSEDKSPFIQQIIKFLKERFGDEFEDTKYIKPVNGIYAKYIYTDSNNSEKLTYNNNGDNYLKGSNIRFGLSSTAELGWLSLYINPEIRYSGDDTDLIMKKAYGVLSFSGLELEAGKDSQWWGPGYHGAILLSNNAEPLTIIKFTNSRPVILPYLLKHLGLFKFTVFTTRLEKERAIPNPYLWGVRINFKPNPYLELGLQRTAMVGGEGGSEGVLKWWKSGKAGDQKAGIDTKLTLPFSWQPLQLCSEIVGEDAGGWFPSSRAYMIGLYLPKILNFERLDLRAEYATTHVGGHPNVWYTHHIYKSGYTFKGRIMGHHIGTDSNDMFVEARYYLPKTNGGTIAISYDRIKHNLSDEIRETGEEFKIKIILPVKKDITLRTDYSYDKIKNFGNVKGVDKNISLLTAEIIYMF